MKHNPGKLLMCFGSLLVLAALLLTAYNLVQDRRAGDAAASLTAQLDAQMPAVTMAANQTAGEDVPDRIETDAMNSLSVAGLDCIGVLDIPALELHLPVLKDYSTTALQTAPCCYAGSLQMNDLVLAGHNYRTHFGHLSNLETGDTVTITDVQGTQYTYLVTDLLTLPGTDVTGMLTGDWDLTLYTCTLGGANRITVRCKRT